MASPDEVARTSSLGSLACCVFQDPDLRRATRSQHLLEGGSRIFQNSEGSADTYELSEPVEAIDDFISHNWSMPRRQKALSLLYFYNLRKALIACAGGAALGAYLTASERLPMFKHSEENGLVYWRGVNCLVLGNVAFFLTLFLSHEAELHLGCKGRMVFLDKICIHQTDEKRKKEGIQKLAAFLNYSRRMVIIYSDVYLHRLWTVYELASFLVLKPSTNLVIVQPYRASLIFAGHVTFFFLSLAHGMCKLVSLKLWFQSYFPRPPAKLVPIIYGPFIVAFLPLLVMFRRWISELARAYTSGDDFRIQEGECFDERDRVTVHGNIAEFMRELGLVPATASDGEALDRFDVMIRDRIPSSVAKSCGRLFGLPYRDLLSVAISIPLLGLDRIVGSLLTVGTLREVWVHVLYFGLWYLTLFPCISAVLLLLLHRGQDMHGGLEWCYLSGVACICFVLTMGLAWPLVELKVWNLKSSEDLRLYVFCGYGAVLSLWTYATFRLLPHFNTELPHNESKDPWRRVRRPTATEVRLARRCRCCPLARRRRPAQRPAGPEAWCCFGSRVNDFDGVSSEDSSAPSAGDAASESSSEEDSSTSAGHETE